jgi:hypothetical protein
VIAALPEKIRRALPRNREARLAGSIEELKLLESKRVTIENFYRDALAKWNSVEGRLGDAEAAYRKALTGRDLAGVDEAVAVLPLLRAQADHARAEAANISSVVRTTSAFAEFIEENRNARELLLTAVRLKLKQAEEGAATALSEEKARLPDWDEDGISHSPKVQRANTSVHQLTALLQRIESAERVTERAAEILQLPGNTD